MTGWVVYNGIPCECPNCNARVVDHNAAMHKMWVNQYGACIRIFCHECGQWTDRTLVDGKDEVIRIVPHAIPHPQYQERMSGI